MRVILVIAVIVLAAACLVTCQEANGAYVKQPLVYFLPDSAQLIVGEIKSTFRCEGRIYGYYADQDNNCQIFHVCVPYVDEEGNDAPAIYSFFCGNQTVFDQASLVCSHPQDATPCDQAQTFYSVNENFGRTDQPLLREK